MKWNHTLFNVFYYHQQEMIHINLQPTPPSKGMLKSIKMSHYKGNLMQCYVQHIKCMQSVFSLALLLMLMQFNQQAYADGVDWESLSPQQQEALAPMRDDWRELPPNRQERLRRGAERWNNLPLEQRNRLQERMHRYDDMRPEEKDRIRERMREFRQLPPEERSQLRERWRNMPPEQRERIRDRHNDAGSEQRGRGQRR